jgi:hypothetical protein
VIEELLTDIAALTLKVQNFKQNFCTHLGCGVPIEWLITPPGTKGFEPHFCKVHVPEKKDRPETHKKHQPEPLSATQMEENRLANEKANGERRAKHSALSEQDVADNAAIVAATMANASFEIAHADKPGARREPKVKRNKGEGKSSKGSRGRDEEEFGEAAPKGKKNRKASKADDKWS